MSHYLGCDQSPGHERLPDQQTIITMDQPDLLQLHRRADLTRQGGDLQHRSGFHTVLFSTRFDYCIHVLNPPMRNANNYHSGFMTVKKIAYDRSCLTVPENR